MTSLKPYLIRSVYDWIVDNDLTPYLLVNAGNNRGQLPEDYIENGKITLNIRPQAVEALSLGNETIEFNARFGGKPMLVNVSINAVMAIFAKENGKGLVFDQEDGDEMAPATETGQTARKPSLHIVK